METQVFILSSESAFDEVCPEARGQRATLVLFRDRTGPISFSTAEQGSQILQAILRDAVVVASNAELPGLRHACNLDDFYTTILARAGICAYGPDSTFIENVEKCRRYILDVQKNELLKRYGKECLTLKQPELHRIFFERKQTDSELTWMLEHSNAVAIWRFVTGTERQPILLGPGQTEILQNVRAICDRNSIKVKEVCTIAELPNW